MDGSFTTRALLHSLISGPKRSVVFVAALPNIIFYHTHTPTLKVIVRCFSEAGGMMPEGVAPSIGFLGFSIGLHSRFLFGWLVVIIIGPGSVITRHSHLSYRRMRMLVKIFYTPTPHTTREVCAVVCVLFDSLSSVRPSFTGKYVCWCASLQPGK